MNKNILLAGALILIMGAVIAIENSKAPSLTGNQQEGQEILLNTSEQNEQLAQLTEQRISKKDKLYPRAVELVSPDGYLNTENITIAELIGKKVILVDFWTYSCINCQRTIPYLTSWHEKYKDDGLVIIGVHTPEFDFEKEYSNVLAAVRKFNITYPVVQDNNYQTWRAYQNRYWPHKYLIDIDGFITYDVIGEGRYSITEQKIQEALEERSEILKLEQDIDKNMTHANATDVNFLKVFSQELYFGYAYERDGQLGNSEGFQPEKVVTYSLPSTLKDNTYYLGGQWRNQEDSMKLDSQAGKVTLTFNAKNVYFVAGANNEVPVTVKVDGKTVNTLIIKEYTLYHAAALEEYGEHTLELSVEKPGFDIFTFTFG